MGHALNRIVAVICVLAFAVGALAQSTSPYLPRVSVSSTGTTAILGARVSGDSQDRLSVNASGKISWGSGSGSADVTLERSGAGAATLTGALAVTGAVTHSALTATTVPYLNGSKALTSSSVTPTELGYLSGVTSALQTQINAKEATITTLSIAKGGTNSATALSNNRVMRSSGGAIVEAAAITASRALVSDTNGIPTHATTTSTEIGYVNGVTSAIQTQLNGKVGTTGNESIAGVKTFSDTTDASSSTAGGTIVSGGLAVAKKLYVGTAVYLPTSGGTASAFNYYEEWSGNVQLQDGFVACSGSAVTGCSGQQPATITRIGRKVTAYFSCGSFTGGNTTRPSYAFGSTANTQIPTRFAPSTTQNQIGGCYINNAGTVRAGSCQINSSGVQFFDAFDGTAGTWTASTKGCQSVTLTWQVF